MSQVNKFNQSNNPDFIYFDLQQANIYNTTEQEQQPLRFSETRETPIVANSGDYHVSVTRFQLDTYNLPVLVAEPDLSQTGTYDPDQTIYKVALTAKDGKLNTEEQIGGYTLTSQIQQQSQSVDYGEIVMTANTGTKNNICVLVTDRGYTPAGSTSNGRVYVWKGTPTSNSIAHILDVPTETNNPYIGWGAGISDDGTKAVAGSNGRGVFLFNLTTGVVSPTHYAVIKPYTTLTKISLSGNGTRLFIGSRYVAGVSNARAFVYNYDTRTAIGAEMSIDMPSMYEKGVYFNTDGDWFISSSYLHDNNRGYVEMRTYNSTSNTWPIISTGNQFSANVGDRLGHTLAISGNGLYAFAVALRTNDTGNYVRVYKRTGNVYAVVTNISATVNLQHWGKSISVSNDGSTLIVSSDNALINIYKRDTGLETYTLFDTLGTTPNYSLYNYFTGISINKTGDAIFSTNSEKIYPAQTLPVTIYNWTYSPPIPVGTSTLPTIFTTTPIIQPLTWIKDEKETSTAPNKNVLTGKNTALYPYYYCNSYGNFITMLNKALKLAYKTLIQNLWTQWIEPLGTETENQFLDIVTKHYPTPPFIDWNETNLTADAYVSLLFETYQSAANTLISNINNINYSMPQTSWVLSDGSGIYTGTPKLNTPLKFELAFNAPLYSLFSSFPSKQSILTHPVSGHKEIYYTLNFFSSGLGVVNPSPNLNSIVDYSFLTAYTNATTGVITFSTTGTKDYSHQRLLIKQIQEISTIDTWTPVNAIVFTTSLPIVLNQFSATSSIGFNLPSSKQDSAFGFVLTDLQSNQQGYRPNVLYVPSAEYRKLDLNGNQPIKNIEINVFWRSKTGDLIPITLASGAMASIKLLFEKKILAENQKINRGSANVRNYI